MYGDSNATLDVVMAGWAGGKGCAVVFCCTTSSSCSNVEEQSNQPEKLLALETDREHNLDNRMGDAQVGQI